MSDQRLADFQASEIVAHAPDMLTVEDDFHGVEPLQFNVVNQTEWFQVQGSAFKEGLQSFNPEPGTVNL
jgi:hypothetical protein